MKFFSPFAHRSFLAMFLVLTNPADAAQPATLADAAAVLDLAALELPAGSDAPGEQNVASLNYTANGEPDATLIFHRTKLLAAGWKETPGSSVTPAYASAVFAKNGFHLSVMSMPAAAGKSNVIIQNLGNVDLAKLPVPAGSRTLGAFPASAIFNAAGSVDAVAAALEKALLSDGWVGYGSSGDAKYFRKNAVRLTVSGSSIPTEAGRSMISVTQELLSAEIPVPDDAKDIRFSGSQKRTDFKTAKTPADVFAFYSKLLAAAGWTTRMTEPTHTDGNALLAFTSKTGDKMAIAIAGENVSVEFQTAREIAEMNRKLDEQKRRYLEKQKQQ